MSYQKLVKLNQKIQNLIQENNISWETKYELIFSENISRKIFTYFKEMNISFDYYDPDTSYEEDVKAFAYAVNNKVIELSQIEYIFQDS